MGNLVSSSCTSSLNHRLFHATTIKVIRADDGGVERHRGPTRADELMLENPRHFVCDYAELRVGDRVPGLSADEELGHGRRYVLLPMDMLYSVLIEEEMAALSLKVSDAAGRRGSKGKGVGRRIIPVLNDFCVFQSGAARRVAAKKRRAARDGSSQERVVARQRSWKPALDTIEEAPT